MPAHSRNRKWALVFGIAIVCAALSAPLANSIFAIRLALAVQSLASGATGQGLSVRQTSVRRRMGMRELEALLYYPENSLPTRAVVLVAGISELGCYHPSLMALSRYLAERGFLVLTPDIQVFRQFQISAEPIDQIAFWYNQVETLEGHEKIRKAGLAGISYSGTLALMAAARPEVRDRAAFVVGIGAYSNLIRCTRQWFAAGPVTLSEGYYPTRFYAKWIVMLAALDLLPASKDRQFLRNILEGLLLQKKIPPAAPGLTPEGERWYRLATMREDQSDPELANEIERYLTARLYRQLDPEEALAELRCPAFLIHGAYDDLIPSAESQELHTRITNSHLLISPFLTHTHPLNKPQSRRQRIGAVFDALVFLYEFARSVR